MGTDIKRRVLTVLSVRVPECQKSQMTA